MSDQEKNKIDFDFGGNAIDVLGILKKELRGLEQNLKRLSSIGTAITGVRGRAKGDDVGASVGDQVAFNRVAMKCLRDRMSFASRMARQRAGEEDAAARAARSAGSEAMRFLRQRKSFAARTTRQREAEEEVAARTEARRVRDQIKHHRFLFGLRMRRERAVAAERQRANHN